VLTYQPSSNIIQLSRPRSFSPPPGLAKAKVQQSNTFSYHLPERLATSVDLLSKPRWTRQQENERISRLFISDKDLPLVPNGSYLPISTRLLALAKPKSAPAALKQVTESSSAYRVSPDALKASPSPRVLTLARPLSRYRSKAQQLDPGVVNLSALLVHCSLRTQELSLPLERKKRAKSDEKKKKTFKIFKF